MKFDKLLNKVSAFEKLACYGNRQSFLRRIAQGQPGISLTPAIKTQIDSLLKNLNVLAPSSSPIQNKLMDFLHDESVNPQDVVKTVQEASTLIPPGHGPQYNQALDLIVNVQKLSQQGETAAQPPPAPYNPGTQPASQESSANLPPIDVAVQSKLNDLLVPSGKIFPLKEDGKLGAQTKAAIDKFREVYHVPAEDTLSEVLGVILSAR